MNRAETKQSKPGKPARPARTPQGLAARDLAVQLVSDVLLGRQPLDQAWSELTARPAIAALEPRDRALARLIAATVLRRQGELEQLLNAFLAKPLPADKGRLWPILLAGAAQLACLGMPPHAVVDTAVELAQRDRGAHRFAKLANAVLRRVGERGAGLLADQDGVRLNTPDWLWQRWAAHYGSETARRIAEASLQEAALDLTLKPGTKAEAQAWADKLGTLLPTGSVRVTAHGRIEDLPGFADGAWWVQDAAAALVVRLAGDVAGRSVADLCAAPGGKTAQLAAAGAQVTAVDVSPVRLGRLRDNLTRLRLQAEVVEADAAAWSPGRTFDIVILDAPCSATGTIRRHPDILRLKRVDDIARMADLQRGMLANAADLVAPGGLLVFATCSLEPEEGERQIAAFLAKCPGFQRETIDPASINAVSAWFTPLGELRTLPFHLSGMDGFYAARLRRTD
ncbi:MAG: RsmB/NOP family class I SAM-dependent RNA methyltransferase [Hyphomicrobiaceae bacterium]